MVVAIPAARLGDGEQIVRRQIHELAENRVAGVAEESNIRADVMASGAAELAVVAVERRFGRRGRRGRPVTPSPVSTTVPAGSWPSTMGYVHGVSPTAPSA